MSICELKRVLFDHSGILAGNSWKGWKHKGMKHDDLRSYSVICTVCYIFVYFYADKFINWWIALEKMLRSLIRIETLILNNWTNVETWIRPLKKWTGLFAWNDFLLFASLLFLFNYIYYIYIYIYKFLQLTCKITFD